MSESPESERDGEPRRLTVEADDAGSRLDAFLSARLGVTRSQTRRLLGRGAVRLDGRPAGAGLKGAPLAAGSRVDVEPFRPPSARRIEPEPEAPLDVLAQGDGWLAVSKPAGVAVHPLEEGEPGTLLAAVAARHPEIQGVGEGGLRSGVVHRLDVDTSGAVLFATLQPAWEALRRAFSAHRVEKVYRAVVLGRAPEEGRADVDLVVARHRPARVRVLDPERARGHPGARRGRLAWRTLERFDTATWIEVRLETGFLHQIRASFAHLGHPVAGDPVYGPGPPADPTGAPRQMLHAARVAWRDVRAESPEPEDLRALLCRLREGEPPAAPPARGGDR